MISHLRRLVPAFAIVAILVGIPLAVLLIECRRKGLSPWETLSRMVGRAVTKKTGTEEMHSSILPKGERIDFLVPRAIGNADRDRPRIAHVNPVDLDGDGLLDVVVSDCLNHRVSWIRQHPKGTFTETPLGGEIRAPAHTRAVDIDADGDLDLLVASMGILWTSNDKVGSVVILENRGGMRFANRVLVDRIARVTDVSAGDLDGGLVDRRPKAISQSQELPRRHCPD